MVCRLSLSDDPSLVMAFSVARRAAAVPVLLVNGTYRSTIRSYLDSSILQHQLQRLSDQGSLKGMLTSQGFLSKIGLVEQILLKKVTMSRFFLFLKKLFV